MNLTYAVGVKDYKLLCTSLLRLRDSARDVLYNCKQFSPAHYVLLWLASVSNVIILLPSVQLLLLTWLQVCPCPTCEQLRATTCNENIRSYCISSC
jgi:hypothetical protein